MQLECICNDSFYTHPQKGVQTALSLRLSSSLPSMSVAFILSLQLLKAISSEMYLIRSLSRASGII